MGGTAQKADTMCLWMVLCVCEASRVVAVLACFAVCNALTSIGYAAM